MAGASLLVCSAVMLATHSRASLLSALIGVSAALLPLGARRWKSHATAILVSGAAAIILALAVLFGTPAGRALMVRSETFNGRTVIWRLMLDRAMQRPWLGWGYGAFWPTRVGEQVRAAYPVPINHAHEQSAIDARADSELTAAKRQS